MWLLLRLKKLLPTEFSKKRKAKAHLKHLEYAYKQLSSNDNEHPMGYEDKCYKLDAIDWLIDYYVGVADGEVGMKTPKAELLRIHRLKSKESGPKEHVFACVLFYWIENKRIDCY